MSITSRRLDSRDFWRIANSVLRKSKSAIPPDFSSLEVLSSASDEAKLFAEHFSRNSNLGDSGISLPVFLSRTNLKLQNTSVTLKMVKKVIDEPSIPELFNKCLKEFFFSDIWKVLSVVPVYENVRERFTAKNYYPSSLLSVVSKVLEKLLNNKIVDHLEKLINCRSIADLVTVVSDRIRTFKRSGVTQAVTPDIFRDFDRVWHVGLLHKIKSYGISGRILGLISSFLSKR